MKVYLFGKIMHINTNYLILDHAGIGELIYVPNISRFKKDELRKIFICNISNEYTNTTYGFDNFKELVLFEDLIALSGIGPKIALSILNNGWENVLSWIANSEVKNLSKLQFVSNKIANNIVFTYSEKYKKFLNKLSEDDETKFKEKIETSKNKSQFEETMKMLGFKYNQIKYALENITLSDNIEQCVENAIKVISLKQQNEPRVQG
ncbi:Holliday junction branch migration protein RuvA [[Mycoplasma] falconis]|uniref:Holliday junction branch migration complex subunit RuvA n=1 Tax=[Mycoplasma] falconis TaxID=92403 RepID=A0A501XA92_9BACT|nr:Holliday junction branch migration protein RuvA [[Mycoplasma] falconis]TPE57431.1 Holliday junction branch migration protein RuvA [[Mycoplasma] falconis]